MSYIFGPARQNGIVVENLDTAVHHWVRTVGAGPFFVLRHVSFDYFTYHGQPSEPDISIALGNTGELQIELIEQHNDAPSPHLHFRRHKTSGLHHISSWTERYDNRMAELRDRGFVPDCEGSIAGGLRFAYFNADALDGSAFEVSDLGEHNEFGRIHDLVRQAAVGWDGSEPLRVLPATASG